MNLENTVVIVADLGELKAYGIEQHEGVVDNEIKVSHSLSLLNDEVFIEGRKKIGEMMSDSVGRLGHNSLENLHLQTEKENRTLKEIAADIESVVNHTGCAQLFLAFPKEHNNELLKELGEATKAVLQKNITSDLVKTDKNKILSHFE
jgi:hypothetical protein